MSTSSYIDLIKALLFLQVADDVSLMIANQQEKKVFKLNLERRNEERE